MAGYEALVRSIFLHSCDTLPDKVSAYLQRAGRHRDFDLWGEVLDAYRPLVDYLPAAYVDFVLEILLSQPHRRRTGGFSSDTFSILGFPHLPQFFPAAPVQGPFLYLLRANESEALRLIHGLTNEAVARWRHEVSRPGKGTSGVKPLPVMLRIDDERREFWGDQNVYYWFRSRGNGPYPAISALMALELWAEEQIEAGRDPQELFSTILHGSECIAVPGICVGISLAYPSRCLEAALPFAVSPALWRMEVARLAADMTPESPLLRVMGYEFTDRVNEQRARRPQRYLDIRALAPMYLFSAPEPVRAAFRSSVSRFTEDPPFYYEEEQSSRDAANHLREQMELLASAADAANYDRIPGDGGTLIQFRPPPGLLKREQDRAKPALDQLQTLELILWARSTLAAGRFPESMTADEALDRARALALSEIHAAPGEGLPASGLDLRATIVEVVAAILATDPQEADRRGWLPWAREVVSAGAKAEADKDLAVQSARLKIRVAAARGLCGLVRGGLADQSAREQLLALVADEIQDVAGMTHECLARVWDIDAVLCWNAVGLALDVALRPRQRTILDFDSVQEYQTGHKADTQAERARVRKATARYISRLRRERTYDPPAIPQREDRRVLDAGRLVGLLSLLSSTLPLNDPVGRARVLRVGDGLVAWTAARNKPPRDSMSHYNEPYQWNSSFSRWIALLSAFLSLDEVRQHFLTPIRQVWKVAPGLHTQLMEAFVVIQLARSTPLPPQIQTIWRDLCTFVLQSSEIRDMRRGYRYLDNRVSESVDLIVFGTWAGPLVDASWPHAVLFTDVIDDWVHAVGHYARPYSHLLRYLEGAGWAHAPEPTLTWLHSIANSVPDLDDFWSDRDNGERTARLLLRVLEKHGVVIRERPESLSRISALADGLAAHGTALGAALQRAIEHRHE